MSKRAIIYTAICLLLVITAVSFLFKKKALAASAAGNTAADATGNSVVTAADNVNVYWDPVVAGDNIAYSAIPSGTYLGEKIADVGNFYAFFLSGAGYDYLHYVEKEKSYLSASAASLPTLTTSTVEF